MKGNWIAFVLLLIVIPFGLASSKKIYTMQHTLTSEQEKVSNERIGRLIVFYWLCDLFYMACFTNNLTLKFVFGGLVISIIFVNLAQSFTFPKERTNFELYSMLQDFTIGLGLSIYLIYIIPNKQMQEIVVPIVAAIFGGLITLTGVA